LIILLAIYNGTNPLYPLHLKMEDSAGIINAFRQCIDEENGCSGAYSPEYPLTKKCVLIMIRSGFLKRASSGGTGILGGGF
jgi:hypothetical protein